MNRILSASSIIGTFSVATSSNNLFIINKEGRVGISKESPDSKLHLVSDGTQSLYSLKIEDVITSPILYVRDDANTGIGTSSIDYTKLSINQTYIESTLERIKGASIYLSATSSRNRTGLEIAMGPKDIIGGGKDDISNNYRQSAIFAYINTLESGYKGQSAVLFEGQMTIEPDNEDINKTGVDISISGVGSINGYIANLVASSQESEGYEITGYSAYISGTTSAPHIGYYSELSAIIDDAESKKYGFRSSISGSASKNYGVYIDTDSSSGENYGVFVLRGSSIFNFNQSSDTDFSIRGFVDDSLFFVDASMDSIGIKNPTPVYELDIIGTVSTTAFRMNTGSSASYIMVSDSDGNGSWTSSISLGFVTASGTINYLPKWESINGLSSTSNVYDDGVTVMIGTNSTSEINLNYGYPAMVSYRVASSNGQRVYGVLSITQGKKILHTGVGENYGFYAKPTGTARMYGYFAEMSDYQNENTGFYSYVYATSSLNRGYYSDVKDGDVNIGFQSSMLGTSGSNTGMYIDTYGSLQSYGIRVNRGTSIFNEANDADTDFRIKGLTENHLLFVDSSMDSVNLATSTGSARLNIQATSSSAGVLINNTTNNSYITLSTNTATFSIGTKYDSTKPYFTISGPNNSSILGSNDRFSIYSDGFSMYPSTSGSGFGPTNLRKGEVATTNFSLTSATLAHHSFFLLGKETSGTSSSDMTLDGNSPSSTNRLTIPTDTAMAFQAHVQGVVGATTDHYYAIISGVIENDNGTTTLVSSTSSVIVNAITGSVSVAADNTNDALRVVVQTTSSKSVSWICRIESTFLNWVGGGA